MRGVHAALHTVVPCRHCRHLSAIGVGADHGAKTIKTSPGHSGFSSTGRRVLNIFGNSHWQHSDVSPSYQHIISYNHIPIIYCIYIYISYTIIYPLYSHHICFGFGYLYQAVPQAGLRSLAVARFIFCYILGLHKECWPGWSWDRLRAIFKQTGH